MKLSFCTTIKNRKWQIQKTFEHNLKCLKSCGVLVEWIIIDFGSSDGSWEWLEAHARNHIDIIKLRKAPHPKTWHMAQCKNIAHKEACGEILMNLDCDNYLGRNTVTDIIQLFESNKNQVVLHQIPKLNRAWRIVKKVYSKSIFVKNVLDDALAIANRVGFGIHADYVRCHVLPMHWTGCCGRIAYTKKAFELIGGYNEQFLSMGFQDYDLIFRLLKQNPSMNLITGDRDAYINHMHEFKLVNKIAEHNGHYVNSVMNTFAQKVADFSPGLSERQAMDYFEHMDAQNQKQALGMVNKFDCENSTNA